MLRLLEAPGPDGTPPMRSPAVVTGGWESRGYRDFRELAASIVRGDATEGFAFLLRLVYADLAMELPGLYGDAGIADLVPIPPATLRHAIAALDDPRLASCWTDDMSLGWVYQYWNDPEREALDDKINAGGKIEPHEIASKTQLFTERYMVDWLLQNSLGPMWLAICKSHGWTPDVEADGTLAALEARRGDWRAKRDSGEVSLTGLMPLHTDAEHLSRAHRGHQSRSMTLRARRPSALFCRRPVQAFTVASCLAARRPRRPTAPRRLCWCAAAAALSLAW